MGNTGTLNVNTPTERELVLTRVFDAPCRLVFDAFTKPEMLKRWLLGPPGWSMTACEVALKAGDGYRWAWKHANGDEMEIKGVCRQFVPPERLVSTESWGGGWPETLNTMVFSEEGSKTTITMTILYPSNEARDAALKTGMKEGMAASYDRLAELMTSAEARAM